MLPHTEGRGDLLASPRQLSRHREQVTPALGVFPRVFPLGVFPGGCSCGWTQRERLRRVDLRCVGVERVFAGVVVRVVDLRVPMRQIGRAHV